MRRTRRTVVGLLSVILAMASLATAQSPPPPPVPDPALTAPLNPPAEVAAEGPMAAVEGPGAEEPEVLTRGPVHEAFAEPVVFDPRPGPRTARSPGAAIEELPPDQKPEGDDVVWIPGYWAWDDERGDFLWISGIWRDLPPGRQWVPGYWNDAEGGSQWVAGYWAPTAQEEVEYLPQPPSSLEVGPNVPAPSMAHSWSPGYWTWQGARYIWSPGCWIAAPVEWVWVPPHYLWTPCGYVFVAGYWDYPVAQRGLLFAPVYVSPVVIAQPAFVYRPAVVIESTVIVDHLFCRPSVSHYYFGDYYAPAYRTSGFFFGLSFNSTRFGYDPIFAHQRVVQTRIDVGWSRRVQSGYAFRVSHVEARPAWTLAAQRSRGGAVIGRPLVEVARERSRMVEARSDSMARIAEARSDVSVARLETLSETRRDEMVRRASVLSQARTQRGEQERSLAASRGTMVAARQDASARRAEAVGGVRERGVETRQVAMQAAVARPLPRSPMAASERAGRT